MTRKVFYDCEFLENGKTIDLISIGMVDDQDRELYLINRNAPWERIAEDPWLMENVVPRLPGSGAPTPENPCAIDFGSRKVTHPVRLLSDVHGFLFLDPDLNADELREPDDNDLELWAWYAAYDHVALAQLWGRMIDMPRGVPGWTNDLRQEMRRLGDPPGGPVQERGEHNALEDARHLKARYDWLAGRQPSSSAPGPTGGCRS